MSSSRSLSSRLHRVFTSPFHPRRKTPPISTPLVSLSSKSPELSIDHRSCSSCCSAVISEISLPDVLDRFSPIIDDLDGSYHETPVIDTPASFVIDLPEYQNFSSDTIRIATRGQIDNCNNQVENHDLRSSTFFIDDPLEVKYLRFKSQVNKHSNLPTATTSDDEQISDVKLDPEHFGFNGLPSRMNELPTFHYYAELGDCSEIILDGRVRITAGGQFILRRQQWKKHSHSHQNNRLYY